MVLFVLPENYHHSLSMLEVCIFPHCHGCSELFSAWCAGLYWLAEVDGHFQVDFSFWLLPWWQRWAYLEYSGCLHQVDFSFWLCSDGRTFPSNTSWALGTRHISLFGSVLDGEGHFPSNVFWQTDSPFWLFPWSWISMIWWPFLGAWHQADSPFGLCLWVQGFHLPGNAFFCYNI